MPNEKEREFQRKPVAFNGELAFTSMLLALENPSRSRLIFCRATATRAR